LTTSTTHRLIVALAAVTALFNLAVLLPGNPYYSSRTEFVIAVLVQALVVWGLWRGSAVVWYVAMFFAAGMIVSIALMDPGWEVGVVIRLGLGGRAGRDPLHPYGENVCRQGQTRRTRSTLPVPALVLSVLPRG
jgi:hypothetical protein